MIININVKWHTSGSTCTTNFGLLKENTYWFDKSEHMPVYVSVQAVLMLDYLQTWSQFARFKGKNISLQKKKGWGSWKFSTPFFAC